MRSQPHICGSVGWCGVRGVKRKMGRSVHSPARTTVARDTHPHPKHKPPRGTQTTGTHARTHARSARTYHGGLRILLRVVPQPGDALGRVQRVHVEEDEDPARRALLEEQVDDLPRRELVVLGGDLLAVGVLQLAQRVRVVRVHGRERELEREGEADGVDLVLEEEVDHLVDRLVVEPLEDVNPARWVLDRLCV